MTRRPTIFDVARQADVSKSTVSLVLQNSPRVADATRYRVEAAMASMGYVRNRSAAHLRGASSGLIGLVINDLRNPFFTEFAASAQMTFARSGYATVIANTVEDAAIQTQVIDSMIEHGVTGFIVCPAYGDPAVTFERIERAGIPTMQVLRQIDARTGLFPFASYDYAGGSTAAARHLSDMGCERIVFAGGAPDLPITAERMAGYVDVTRAAGRTPRHFPGWPSRALGREIALDIAANHSEVDAALCFSDLVALGMLSGFAEAGVAVGRDVRLVGFDDIEEASLSYPRLSSVHCDTARFGEAAAEAVLGWVAGAARPPAETRVPVHVVARQSSLGVDG